MLEVYRFKAGKTEPQPLSLDEAAELVGTKHDDLVWINVEEPTDDDIDQLTDALDLDPFLVEDLREGSSSAGQRPKVLPYGDMFHVAAHDCTVKDDDLLEREIDLVFGGGWLCSVRHGLVDVDDDPDPFPMQEVGRRVKADCATGTTIDEGVVLWAFLDVITDRYFAITTDVDNRIDAAEAEYLREDDSRTRPDPETLYRIGRLLTDFRRQVVPLREAAGALLRGEDPDIGEGALLRLRDVYDHLQGINELIETQRDVLAGLRDVQLAVVSNRLNKSAQQLAAWGAILIVATLITGILGMNFRDEPSLHWWEGFLVVVGVMLVIALPMYVFFKKKDWL